MKKRSKLVGLFILLTGIMNAQNEEVNGEFKVIHSNGSALGFDGYQGISTTGGAHWLHLNRYSNDNVAIGLNSTANVYLVNGGGNVGIGTSSPKAKLDVGSFIPDGALGTVFGRLSEGNTSGDGTYLGVKGYGTQNSNYDGKGFSIVHNFFGNTNSSINFFRGGSVTGGFLTFNTNDNTEKMRINSSGNVGIGTSSPGARLEVKHNGTIGGYWNPSKSYFNVTNGSESLIFDGNEIYNNTTLHIGSVGDIKFRKVGASSSVDNVIIKSNGNVGIGTTDPQNELSVNGTIWATEVKIQLTDAGDWVFDESYYLRPLNEVADYIKENKHLPEIPSAQEFRENDLKISEMTNKLLVKIEELTLYAIEQENKIKAQEERLSKLEQLLLKE